MIIEQPKHVRALNGIERERIASQVNCCIRLRAVSDPRVRTKTQLSRLPDYSIRLEAYAPTDKSQSRWASAFAKVGASRLVPLSLPFYLADGIVAYELGMTADAIKEVSMAWAHFDYVIAGFRTGHDLPVALAYVDFEDFCLLMGPLRFLAVAKEDGADDESEFVPSAYLSRVISAASEYLRLQPGCTTEF